MVAAIATSRQATNGTHWSVLVAAGLAEGSLRPGVQTVAVLCRADLDALRDWLERRPDVVATRSPNASPEPDRAVTLWVEDALPSCEQRQAVERTGHRVGLIHTAEAGQDQRLPAGWEDLLRLVRQTSERYARRHQVPTDDLAQEVMMRLWRRRNHPQAIASWESLAVRITHNTACRLGRRQAHVIADSELVEGAEHLDRTGSPPLRELLLQLPLHERERQIVEAFGCGAGSIRAIARATKRAPCRIRSTLRGMARRLGAARGGPS